MRLEEREQVVEPTTNAKRVCALPVDAPAIPALRVVLVREVDEWGDAVPDLAAAGRDEELVADGAAGHGAGLRQMKGTVADELTELIVQVVVLDEHDADIGRLGEAGIAGEDDGAPLPGACHDAVVVEKGGKKYYFASEENAERFRRGETES